MDALITLLATPVAAEALKTWGAWAICLMLLGGLCWILWASLRTERAARQADRIAGETTELRLQSEIARLQDLRLQDAQKLIEVARSGTATMAQRTQGDADLQRLLLVLAQVLQRDGLIQAPLASTPMLPARSP